MEEKIIDYLRIIHVIAVSKGGDIYAPTMPGLNIRRMDLHEALFKEIAKTLNRVDGFTEEDAYWRSKDLFSRLDKIFRLYNDFDLEPANIEHIKILEKDLYKFISSTEVKYYLEGRINGVHDVIEE